MSPKEAWRALPGYEGLYEVSDLGRVRSLDHQVPHVHGSRMVRGRVLSDKAGGSHAQVNLCRNGEQTTHWVHRLVLLAFRGPPSEGDEGCHRNGNGRDNRLSNLRWDTQDGNRNDSIALGAVEHGERHHASKLTGEDVKRIREIVLMGGMQRDVARVFRITQGHVSAIVDRKFWRRLP